MYLAARRSAWNGRRQLALTVGSELKGVESRTPLRNLSAQHSRELLYLDH